jgi:hypothetical protein
VARTLDAVSRDHPGITIVSAGPPANSPVTACRGRVPALSSLQRVAGALANARRD